MFKVTIPSGARVAKSFRKASSALNAACLIGFCLIAVVSPRLEKSRVCEAVTKQAALAIPERLLAPAPNVVLLPKLPVKDSHIATRKKASVVRTSRAAEHPRPQRKPVDKIAALISARDRR